ncbi:MAG: HK97 family phage prohead protease [Holdemanella porci]
MYALTSVDDKGLWGEVEINESDQDAMNLYARVQRGDVDQCSFGFEITSEEYSENGKWSSLDN